MKSQQERIAAFAQRHPAFVNVYNERLMQAANAITGKDSDIERDVPFALVVRAVRDFEAIVALVSIDIPSAAQSILRSMFERVVTIAHLRQHPDQLQDFKEFDYVQRRKLYVAVRDVTGENPLPALRWRRLRSGTRLYGRSS